MAYNTNRIQVPTSVRLEIENQAKVMKDLQTHLRNVFADVEPGSALEKSLNKVFDNMDRRFEKLDDIFKEELFSESDLAKVNKIIEAITDSFSELDRKIGSARISALGVDLKEVEKAAEALNKLSKEILQVKEKSAASILGNDSEKLKAFVKVGQKTGFKGGESYKKNIDNLKTSGEKAETQIASLTSRYEELEAAEQKAQLAANEFNKANLQLAKNQIAQEIVNIGKTTKTKDSRFAAYEEYFKSKIGSAPLSDEDNQAFVSAIGEWLEIDPNEIAGYADRTADEVITSLVEAMRRQADQHKKDFGGINVLQNIAKNQLETDRLAGITSEQLKAFHGEAKAKMAEANNELASFGDDTAEKVKKQLEEAQSLLALIQQQLEELRELSKNYDATVDDRYKKQREEAHKTLKEATEAARAVKQTESSSAAESARRVRRTVGNTYVEERNKNQHEAESARDAERFEAELKSSLSHWFSAQQAINMIKDGLRQAWTDIQGLDKAMTNIAVVTDMSVSDLWGKIDQYMAIAQDYGVTTQGVYEVSQLYYQQGLSASEVMEATTETLKMARIAGMDYSEAADAMTVAIRAFKMEMSDAQVITDVYSKVAAVTASDSQELAIAMSKTASSAESVGSSFENTTAMLAVMIETTRESAQNLGSALKSIISRYGEMKAGLTVDSEGEAIDYNKVDTALKSVGISIKDAQGQFRDFDDVIFELSEKWDTLDKNTQRYIATIMAGNRQQSRFIALVDSGDRLKEVMDAAHNSADAGLLQYAKTLDSLETKLNALSTSFQQFYMNIVNGDTFKWLIDLITNVLNGLNKIGTASTILTGVTLVKALKTFAAFVLGNFSGLFSEIRRNYKTLQDDLTRMTREGHAERMAIENGSVKKYSRQNNPQVKARQEQEAAINKAQAYIQAANIAGSIATVAGTALTGKGHERWGSGLTGVGNIASAAGTGASLGMALGTAIAGPAGTIAGAKIGALIAGGVTAVFSTIDFFGVVSKKLEFDIEKAKENAEKKNLDRATAAEEERNLKSTIENLKKLQEARYQSAEAEQAYIEASKEALASFPELEAQLSSSGDVWIDVLNHTSNAEELLAQAREKTRKATLEAAAAERDQAIKEQKKAQQDLAELTSPEKLGELLLLTNQGLIEHTQNGFKFPHADWIYDTNIPLEDLGDFIAGLDDVLSEATTIPDFINILKSQLSQVFKDENGNPNESLIDSFINTILQSAYGSSYKDVNQLLGKIQTAEMDLSTANQKVAATDKASITAYLGGKENLSTSQRDLLAEWLYQNRTEADFQDNNFVPTTEGLLKGIADYEAAFTNLTDEQKKVFDEAIAAFQKGQYTTEDLGIILSKTFGENLPQAIGEWFKLQNDNFVNQITNFGSTLIGGEQGKYTSLLYSIPEAFYSIITDYSDWLTANVKSKDNPLDSAVATNSLNELLNLMADATNEELVLLGQSGTDITSITGLHNFISTLKKSGVSEERLKVWKDFTPAIINFTTEWAAFNKTATSQLHVFSEKLSKAQSGMDLEEATKLASQLGIGLNEFDVENGKFVLKDITALEEKYLRPIWELRDKIKNEGEDNPEAEKLAKETTEILNKYENSLYVNFYITTGQFAKAAEKINASLDNKAKLTEDELKQLEQIFKTGIVPEDISPRILTAINPYKETITKSIVDNFVNVWSGIASAFGTDKLFTATDVNREIYQNLATLGIFSSQGGDLYQLNKNLSEDDLRKGLQGITDVKERNKIYKQWNDYKNKTTEALEKLFTGTGKVDYAFVNELASDLNRDAADFTEKYFLKQADGTYRANKAFWDNLSTILGSSYTNEQVSEVINKIWTNELQQDLKKKDFLQGLSKDATVKDLLEAQDQGWLTVTDTMMANIKVGMTSVYKELKKVFADDDNFKIGQTLQTEEITTGLNDSINSLLSDPTSASIKDLRDLYHKATGLEANSELTQSYYDAIVEAKNGNIELLRTYILEIARQASLNDTSIDVEKINRTLSTAQQELSSILIKGLEAAIKGTLSANDMTTLSKELRIDIQHYADSTIDGYKVSAEGLLKIGTEMVQKYGNTYDVAKKLSELFIGEGGIYKGYRDIVKAAEELNKKIEDAADSNEKTTAEYRKQKKLLTEMAKIAMFNGDDPLFKFMDQDPTKGYGLSAESMAKSIDKVKDSFESIRKKKNISSSDFYNMMDFMYDQLGDWDSFASALGISDATLAKLKVSTEEGVDIYSSFVNAIVSQSKELGEVDADVLIGLGLSAEKMAGGMSKSLKEVADDQIAQLEALKETLEAMKTLEELGDIKLGLGFTADDGTDIDLLNFDKYIEEFKEKNQLDALAKAIEEKLSQVKEVFEAQHIDIAWEKIFGTDGFTITDVKEQAAVKNLGKFIQMYGNDVTSETWTAFARRFTENGKELNWNALIDAIVHMQDWDTFAYGLTDEIQKNINNSLADKEIKGITIDGSTIKKAEGFDSTSVVEAIKSAYGEFGYEAIEVDVQGEEIKVNVVNAAIKTQIDTSRSTIGTDGTTLTWEFLSDTETYRAEATIDTIDTVFTVNQLGEVTYETKSGAKLNQNTVKEFLNNQGLNIDTIIEEGAVASKATFNLVTAGGEETATTVSTINEDVRAIRTALENPIKIEVDDQASNKLDTIKESYNLLADTLEARPLVINAQGDSLSSVVSSKDGEKSDETDLPTLTQKISVSWEGLDGWKQDKELVQPVKVKYNFGEYQRSGLTQDVTVNYKVGTVEKLNLSGASGGNSGTEQTDGPGGAAGNVNLLKLGAAYARGTLMGELGPELYVQNGAYHIAGAHGPEFVDLDPDAIVFNHLQTANLLGKGHTSKTGSPVVSERRSVAFATGNVTGPAMASGLDEAIAAIDRAIAMWQNIANSTTKDLLNNSGKNKGGGSGNTLKAVTEELEEWYNLTRQIEDIEQEITNLTAERANIRKEDGESYLRSLREEQKLLNQQIATQRALLDYQELQLQRQAKHIEQNAIWSQFLTVDENGLLQYISGNETNGGKGALQVLQELNQMSGKEQTAYLKKLGYSYTDNDGKVLEGTKLVEQFFEELQKQIEQYDALYDTVRGTEKTLENLKTEIEQINEEIKQNQMDLEQAVFDIIVKAWEKEIKQMEEQAGLIKEANKAYIDGLNEALSVERQLYEDNQKIADREQLQRQLSLLRRSGGSASEIANLEEQLNDMLKDEYFSNQKQMIEDIQQANDIQVQQLETQIRLQEEALEFQKEHGVIWQQVYEVLSKSREEILAFMQGNSTEFFSKSLLQQEQMLTEWAHKIGIYKEDQKYQNYVNHAQTNLWENGQAWNIGDMSKYQSTYNNLTDEEKNTIRDQFTSVYAQARLDGKDHNTAAAEAATAVSQTLKRKQDANNAQNNQAPTTDPNPTNPGGGSGDGGNSGGGSSGGGSSSNSNSKIRITVSAGDGHGSPMPQTASVSPKTTFTVQPNPDGGYAFDYITYNGTKKYSTSITPTGQVASIDIKVYYKQTSNSSSSNNNNTNNNSNSNYNPDPSGHEVANGQGTGWHFHINKDGKAVFKSVAYQTREQATAAAKSKLKDYPGHKYSTKYYMHGGLVDYTGTAIVHGSKSRPESFLNAEQTAQIREGLKESGKGGALEGIKAALLKLDSSIKAVTNISNKSESNSYTIAPGAVVIQVEQLNDAYDVDTLSADIMNRMYTIGNKSTNRGVSRR